MKHRSLCMLALMLAALLLFVGCAASTGDKAESYPGEYNNGSGGAPGAADKNEAVNPDGTTGTYDRKIIRTVTMSCESKSYDDAVSVIMDALATHGGYVESSSSYGGGVQKSAAYTPARRSTYTLRVPAERLDAFLEALRTDGNLHITDQSMNSNEITGSYYDTKTRIETLTAEKDALTAMLAGFTDYNDISAMLEVQRRLYDVIEEIETLQTKLNLYDSQVALSTVNLTLQEVIEYTEKEDPTFGERIGKAFTESWRDFGNGCLNFAVWFVEAFPTLIILGGIAAVVMVLVRRSIKRKKNK